MTIAVLDSGTILVDDALRAEAQSVVSKAHDRRIRQIALIMDDGSEIKLPSSLTRFLGHVVHGLSRGPVSVTTLPDELTTTTAAEMLGVSRPTLMKWVANGDIGAKKVGSHTRLLTHDVLTLRKALRQKQRAAFEALRAFDEEFDDI